MVSAIVEGVGCVDGVSFEAAGRREEWGERSLRWGVGLRWRAWWWSCMKPRISRMGTNGRVCGGMFGEGQRRAGLVGRGQIVVERTMLPWWGDRWMLWRCGGSAAPAGAGVC